MSLMSLMPPFFHHLGIPSAYCPPPSSFVFPRPLSSCNSALPSPPPHPRYKVSQFQMMAGMNFFSTAVALTTLLQTGGLFPAIAFMVS